MTLIPIGKYGLIVSGLVCIIGEVPSCHNFSKAFGNSWLYSSGEELECGDFQFDTLFNGS